MTANDWRRFDPPALYAALDAERHARGMSWRQLSETLGVSVSTMTRMKDGGRLELDGVLFMVQWLGVPVETFLRAPGKA